MTAQSRNPGWALLALGAALLGLTLWATVAPPTDETWQDTLRHIRGGGTVDGRHALQ